MLASISTTVTIVDYLRRWPHPGSIVLLILMLGLWLTSVLVGVQVYANYVLAPQAIILEDCGPWSGLGRSRQLMKVSSRRAFLIVIPISALVYLLTAIPAALVGFVVRSRSGTFSDMDLAHIQMMVTLAAHFGLIIALPLQYAFLTLVYYDLRISTEGYDLEALAQNEALP